MDLKKELYLILEKPTSHNHGVLIQTIIYINIIVSILILFLESEKSMDKYSNIFDIVNTVNIMIFTIEYICRLYAIKFIGTNRVKYMFTPFMIIDLLVLLPFYLSFLNVDLSFLRALRGLRIFKLFRLAKFVEFDNILAQIFSEKKEEFLFIIIASIIILFTITPLVFYFENEAQPEVFGSMFDTMWWAIITFTTVGYGDMYPITGMGRVLTTFISVLGIAFYAIPGSIFTSALLEKMNHRHKHKHKHEDSENNEKI